MTQDQPADPSGVLSSLRSRVERGAIFLDAKVPGWWERVNVAGLNLSNCEDCVLGQLVPTENLEDWCYTQTSFDHMRLLLGINDSMSVSHGFTLGPAMASGGLTFPDHRPRWATLTTLWRDAIGEREGRANTRGESPP